MLDSVHLRLPMYSVKEVYYTIQGEGFHTGRPAVFLRFSGCNLWSGLEKDRSSAICQFCDTDFWGTDGVNGGKYTADALARICQTLWPEENATNKFLVCTGGEPILQLDIDLISVLHDCGFEIAVESNGTLELPEGIDWVCISPKSNSELKVTTGDEIKLVFPQEGIDFRNFEELEFNHFYLQPLDDDHQLENIQTCISICKDNPKWKLSLQTHKLIGIP